MSKPRILYVDDEHDNLMVFKMVFRYNYNIVTAVSGQEALEILKKDEVDIIVSDQRMPEMTGLELFEKLKANGSTVPCILLSGLTDLYLRNDFTKTNIVHYATKPWKAERMSLVFERVLRG